MLRLFLNFTEFPDETFSGGERMAVRGNREEEGRQMQRWRESSIRKS